MILTPRDWQAMAQREASELLGTHQGASKLAEAKRYGALDDVIEQQHRDIERLSASVKVSIPTDVMEQEIAAHVRRAVVAEREACAMALESRAQWIACDCGCPEARTVKGPRDAAFMQAAGIIRCRAAL